MGLDALWNTLQQVIDQIRLIAPAMSCNFSSDLLFPLLNYLSLQKFLECKPLRV
jgi:hypothetical protein